MNEEKPQPPQEPARKAKEGEPRRRRRGRREGEESSEKRAPRREQREESSEKRALAPLRVSVFYGAELRPLLRPSPRPVLGSTSLRGVCEKPLERGRALTPLVPCPHQEGDARSFTGTSSTPAAGKKAGKPAYPCRLFLSTCHTPAFSDPFQRGKGRSVVRGGWHAECREW